MSFNEWVLQQTGQAIGWFDVDMQFDVVVAGGSTAAVAAAIAAAESGARTALLEPTEWYGGQLTASGVSAVDWAWHKLGPHGEYDIAAIARQPENITPNFRLLMDGIGNPGNGWVSRNCYEPKQLLTGGLGGLVEALVRRGALVVFKGAVVKRVEMSGGSIKSLTAVQRRAGSDVPWGGYDELPSQDVPRWYEEGSTSRYQKRRLTFRWPSERKPTIFIDATDWGELLALTGASYILGAEQAEGSFATDDTVGQACVFPFVERFTDSDHEITADAARDAVLPAPTAASHAFYDMKSSTVTEEERARYLAASGRRSASASEVKWDIIFRYRRIRGQGSIAHAGELTLQNWNPGNDFPFAYLFRSIAEADAERGNWQGGVRYDVMAAAEAHAFGWHRYFRHQGAELGLPVVLDFRVLGTGHGLSKLPYIRDTRRSVGLGDFVLQSGDLLGPPSQLTGKRFADRVAIGCYALDFHNVSTRPMPAYLATIPEKPLPFYLPFRALTNRDVGNMLVAGKTMAQTFAANAATRLHPIEWSTGTAAGAAAAHMARWALDARAALSALRDVQAVVRQKTPIDWTISGRRYPEGRDAVW